MGVKTSGTAKKKLKEILKRCKNLKEPMTRISVDMKNEIRGNIDRGHSFDGIKWKKSKRASEEGGKTLKDTGRLYNSFRNTAGRNYARVGTNVIYARTLNQGADKGEFGEVSFTVRQHSRRLKKYRKRITVRSYSRTAKVPWGDIQAYRYMGINQEMKRKYIAILTKYIIKGR
ncbi:phage virion morphogenesis protein [Fusobacterium perfoetens]|uniref:phage virion morphogenesis protein n=1 Tax=Fusobacterium perfoetens TaxID=852 RepID=UPI001F47A76A|nr:phage virion morphogenesis protein [Fusobacterium perfoetens]MCF2626247.1 phage virion morphogenesis protein [Fusobacterium perfoetens]